MKFAHPDVLLAQITSAQLSEWEAYDRLDPIGEMRGDIRSAQLRSLITNIMKQLYPEEGVEPVLTSPSEFMIDWGGEKSKPEPPQQSVQDQKRILLGIARVQKKKAEREKYLKNRPPPAKYRKK